MTELHESSAISTVSLPVQAMNTSSKSTNIYISISQQSVLLILTAFVNSQAGRITVEKNGLRYITIANTTPHPPYNASHVMDFLRTLFRHKVAQSTKNYIYRKIKNQATDTITQNETKLVTKF